MSALRVSAWTSMALAASAGFSAALVLMLALTLALALPSLRMPAGPAAVGVGTMMLRGGARGAPVGHLEFHADQLLDVAQIRHLLVVTERDRDAFGAGARGAADAVDVAFRD